MQTDGWPEMGEGKHPDMINEQDLLQAKTVILNWIKDLRAQPEVGSSDIHITCPVHLPLLLQQKRVHISVHADHPAAKCVAWGTCGKGSGGPAVSLAMGSRG